MKAGVPKAGRQSHLATVHKISSSIYEEDDKQTRPSLFSCHSSSSEVDHATDMLSTALEPRGTIHRVDDAYPGTVTTSAWLRPSAGRRVDMLRSGTTRRRMDFRGGTLARAGARGPANHHRRRCARAPAVSWTTCANVAASWATCASAVAWWSTCAGAGGEVGMPCCYCWSWLVWSFPIAACRALLLLAMVVLAVPCCCRPCIRVAAPSYCRRPPRAPGLLR